MTQNLSIGISQNEYNLYKIVINFDLSHRGHRSNMSCNLRLLLHRSHILFHLLPLCQLSENTSSKRDLMAQRLACRAEDREVPSSSPTKD